LACVWGWGGLDRWACVVGLGALFVEVGGVQHVVCEEAWGVQHEVSDEAWSGLELWLAWVWGWGGPDRLAGVWG
jgi:hypothetical protein